MQRLDHFMDEALSNYYDSRDPFGTEGDFITAPEISQLFGEIIGIWALKKWVEIGSPSSINLIEIGPGRGTLMADLLRGTKHISAFHESINVHLIETSTFLKSKQQIILSDYDVIWHEHLQEVSVNEPAIIIANEFFDALPVRQFRRQSNNWQEHYINGQETNWIQIDKPSLKSTLPSVKPNDIFEYSEIQENYAKLLANYKGAALIIDYGYTKSAYGDSLQALHKHKPCKITDHIGEADLTTHVDFEWLSSFFQNVTIKTQSEFLIENGISIRYQQLGSPPALRSGYERLINPVQMGNLFKVLDISL